MTSVSAGHIIQTPTQPVGSGRPQRESNPEPPHQESRALPTELPRPPSDMMSGPTFKMTKVTKALNDYFENPEIATRDLLLISQPKKATIPAEHYNMIDPSRHSIV